MCFIEVSCLPEDLHRRFDCKSNTYNPKQTEWYPFSRVMFLKKVYFQCIVKHLINPQERQRLMFSYSTSFDIHWLICGDIFQPNSRFCVPTQFMQKQTNTCEEKNTCQNKKIHVRTKNTCEKNKQTHVRTKNKQTYVRTKIYHDWPQMTIMICMMQLFK